MLGSAFGIAMTIILVIYVGYYGFNIIKDLFFDKSKEVVAEVTVEEKEVDIGDELKDFTMYDANEEDNLAKARKESDDSDFREELVHDGEKANDYQSDIKSQRETDAGSYQQYTDKDMDEEKDDTAFSEVETQFRGLDNEPSMSGGIEADSFEEMDDAAFKEVDYYFHQIAA